jgi:hypothetical protein
MPVNIEQLEREIDTFYDNVLASNDLMRIIKEIADTAANQNKILQEQADLLELAITQINKPVKPDNSNTPPPVLKSDIIDIKKNIVALELIISNFGKSLNTLNTVSTPPRESLDSSVKSALAEIQRSIYAIKIPEMPKIIEVPVKSAEGGAKSAAPAASEPSAVTEKIEFPDYSQQFEGLHRSIAQIPAQTSAQIADDNIDLIKKTLTQLIDIQTKYSKEMEAYKSHISEVHDDFKSETRSLNEKYDDFLRYIETLNISDIGAVHDICNEVSRRQKHAEDLSAVSIGDVSANIETQIEDMSAELSAKMNKKLLPVYVGFGITIALLIISIIVR